VALLLAVSALTCAFAAGASASPAWRFNGAELVGSETIAGSAILSSMTIPGLTTTCKRMDYEMTISNSAGIGKAEWKSLTFKTCFTSSKVCAVEAIGAEKLPWTAHLATVGLSNYVFVEGIRVAIRYSGEECVLGETTVVVSGSAAGLYDNVAETFSFNATNSKAAKAELKALGSTIEWKGSFTTEATGSHAGQALTVS
jgi:hypothetical protein